MRNSSFIPVVLGIVATLVMASAMGAVVYIRDARGAAATNEQQVADECIKSAIAWTERIGPAGRDYNQVQRRAALGQIFFRIAEVCSADPMFHPQRDFACEALRVYFPEIECWACEN